MFVYSFFGIQMPGPTDLHLTSSKIGEVFLFDMSLIKIKHIEFLSLSSILIPYFYDS